MWETSNSYIYLEINAPDQFHSENMCFYTSVTGKTESRIGIGILEGQKLVNQMQRLRKISNSTSLKWYKLLLHLRKWILEAPLT